MNRFAASRRTVVGGALAASALPHVRALAQTPASGGHVQAVVSAQTEATDAGIAILQAGGTAADAAVAVAAALTVTEGWFSSVFGGGTWALYYDAATGEVVSLDGVGPTGSLATREDYAERASDSGIHQSIVPGAWDGWMVWLQRYGQLDLGTILEPSIALARNGFPASERLAQWVEMLDGEVLNNPGSWPIYAAHGALAQVGETIVMEDLADTFADFVEVWNAADSRDTAVQACRDHFYRGPYAEEIVAYSDLYGGYLTLDDFTSFETGFLTPLSVDYNGVQVFENPPNSQGITMLLALNILKGMGLGGRNVSNPDAVHAQIEAVKLAYADRHFHIGDPERVEMAIEELLSDDYAAVQRERIDMRQAMAWPIESGLEVPSHTTTFHIVDQFGNAAAVTTSLGAHFLVIPGTGIHMNNRMRMLSVESGNINELTPGYKVRHTSCPWMALREGKPYILSGNTGADSQPQCQVQQFMSVVEFGLTAQEAMDRPRWLSTAWPSGSHNWEVGNQLRMQDGFIQPLKDVLVQRGHDVAFGSGTFGSAGMIIVSDDGLNADIGTEPAFETSHGVVIPG